MKTINAFTKFIIIVFSLFLLIYLTSLFPTIREFYATKVFGLSEGKTVNKDFYSALIAIFGVIALMGNFWIYSKRLSNQEVQIALQTQSNLDQRFGIAVELLGNTSESVRIGALYSLYHLARENEKYRQTITDIFCSHIKRETTKNDYLIKNFKSPAAEIQLAIDLLFKKDGLYYLFHNELESVNIKNSILNKINLNNAYCEYVDFSGSIIISTKFIKSQCTGAKFRNTKCINVDFEDAILFLCDFSSSKIYSCHFEQAILHGGILSRAELIGSNFYRCKAIGLIAYFVDFTACSLYETVFYGVVFTSASFYGCSTEEIIVPFVNSIFSKMSGNPSKIDKSIFDRPEQSILNNLLGLIDRINPPSIRFDSILKRLNDCCSNIPADQPNKCKGTNDFNNKVFEPFTLTDLISKAYYDNKWEDVLKHLKILPSEYDIL